MGGIVTAPFQQQGTWGKGCQGVSRTDGPTKVDEQEHGKEQPLARFFFLESSVEDKGHD